MPRKLTVDKLAAALRDAFNDDGWGDVDPYLFAEVAEPIEGSSHAADAEALRATLQHAVDMLNQE